MTIFDARPNDTRLHLYPGVEDEDTEDLLWTIELGAGVWDEPRGKMDLRFRMHVKRGDGLAQDLGWITEGMEAAYLAGRADVFAALADILREHDISASPILESIGPMGTFFALSLMTIEGRTEDARHIAERLHPILAQSEDTSCEDGFIARAMCGLILGNLDSVFKECAALEKVRKPRGQDGLLVACDIASGTVIDAVARADQTDLGRSLQALHDARLEMMEKTLGARRRGREWFLFSGMFWDPVATAMLRLAPRLGLEPRIQSPFFDLTFCLEALGLNENQQGSN